MPLLFYEISLIWHTICDIILGSMVKLIQNAITV